MGILNIITTVISSGVVSAIVTKYLDMDFKIEQFKLKKLFDAEQEAESLDDSIIPVSYDNDARKIFEKYKVFFSEDCINTFNSETSGYYDDNGNLFQEYCDLIDEDYDNRPIFKYLLLRLIREDIDKEVNCTLVSRIIKALSSNWKYLVNFFQK